MHRYIGDGDGEWRGDAYRYLPSIGDRVAARDFAERMGSRRAASCRTGYGAPREVRPAWYVTGFLGEVAALHPIRSGPDQDAYSGSGWAGHGDHGPLEIRTTSTRQLYGFAKRPDRYDPGLGGWRITSKDRGRLIVCVADRGVDFLVMGWARADDVARLPEPLGAILAVIEPPELLPLRMLAPYA